MYVPRKFPSDLGGICMRGDESNPRNYKSTTEALPVLATIQDSSIDDDVSTNATTFVLECIIFLQNSLMAHIRAQTWLCEETWNQGTDNR